MAAKTFEQVLDEVRGKPILVANRGIPARRICRAIRERFAAVPVMTATDIDKAAPAASSAQELLLLGSDPRAYLDLDLIIAKAKQRGIIAIHPGWGFASEDERFPQKCEEAGITFIGSKADSMNLLGARSPSGSASPWCPARKARSTCPPHARSSTKSPSPSC